MEMEQSKTMSDDAAAFRWGVLGPGKIARRFAAGLAHCSSPARVAAVGSRSIKRAEAFAAEFGGARAYSGYDELAADKSLDAIYIATPHSEHASNAILCLEHGRPVLVEKPFTLNRNEAKQIIDTARARQLFLHGSDVDAVFSGDGKAAGACVGRNYRARPDGHG